MKNFWQVHGIFFLIFITLFPRLTMLFAVSAPFGVLAWLGWIFFPYLTVAVLATQYYWQTNPILCTIAWFIAFAGTSGEVKLGQEVANPHSSFFNQTENKQYNTEATQTLKWYTTATETLSNTYNEKIS